MISLRLVALNSFEVPALYLEEQTLPTREERNCNGTKMDQYTVSLSPSGDTKRGVAPQSHVGRNRKKDMDQLFFHKQLYILNTI